MNGIVSPGHGQVPVPQSVSAGRIPLVYEGVEAGENQQRNHGTQGHGVIELGLQDVARVSISLVDRLIGRRKAAAALQSVGEVL